MAHKTLISGTAYSVTGGRELIAGTGYGCKAGKTLIGGTAFTVPFAKGVPLSTITPGAILYLNESGSPVPFYIAKHDYESGLNGAGRTLVVRKDCYDMRAFGNSYVYANNTLDSWLNRTYLELLDENTKKLVDTTKIYYTPGNGVFTVSQLQRAVFQLSITEIGGAANAANKEGTLLPIADKLKIAYRNGGAVAQWTRSVYPSRIASAVAWLESDGSTKMGNYKKECGSRPAFTLPATTAVVANADGTYSLAS